MVLLITGCFDYSKKQIDELKSLGCNVFYMQQENEELPIAAEKVDAIVCNGLFLSHDIDEFTNLKCIQLTSAGLDRVPVDKIRDRGIVLFSARGVYSVPMAEWAVFRILEYYKQGRFFQKEQGVNHWTKHRGLREIAGTKVAIVGAGNVGQEVARRLQAFSARITGFDIHTNDTPGFDSMALVDTVKTCIAEYDIVVLTAPLLPSTKGLISRDILNAMKSGALLVNIARGGLVDEQALCEVLASRPDLYAALDVFETEPLPSDSPLWKLDNVAVSPHNSFVGDGNNTRMFMLMYDNLKRFITGYKERHL